MKGGDDEIRELKGRRGTLLDGYGEPEWPPDGEPVKTDDNWCFDCDMPIDECICWEDDADDFLGEEDYGFD